MSEFELHRVHVSFSVPGFELEERVEELVDVERDSVSGCGVPKQVDCEVWRCVHIDVIYQQGAVARFVLVLVCSLRFGSKDTSLIMTS